MRSIRFSLTEAYGANRNHHGVFHGWGMYLEVTNEGAKSVTKAIVEDVKTGNCYMVYPHQIKFVGGILENINRDVSQLISNYAMAESKKPSLLRHINNYFKNLHVNW
jgi:hypothetical protein